MEPYLEAIQKCIEQENWYGALALSLSIPDICAGMNNEPQGKSRYITWYNRYMDQKYSDVVSGADCYAFRCSFLHEGSGNTERQPTDGRNIDRFIFLPTGPHLNTISNSVVGDPKYDNRLIVQLSVKDFTHDLTVAARKWLRENKTSAVVSENIDNILKIHTNGVHIGGIFIN